MAQAADDKGSRGLGLAEANLGFRGVNVDVDPFRVDDKVQNRRRVTIPRQEIKVSDTQGAQQQPVLHRPAVHEQVLLCG